MLWHLFLACIAVLVCVGSFVKRLRPWFLAFGCLGVLVAFVLALIPTRHIIPPRVLLVLWPPSIVGIADPSTTGDKIVVAAFEFGGNFILYGAVGTLAGLGCRPRSASRPNLVQ